MAEIKAPFRIRDKAEPDQLALRACPPQDADDLFDQYIDSDPLDLSSSDNTADQSDFSMFFDVPGSPIDDSCSRGK